MAIFTTFKREQHMKKISITFLASCMLLVTGSKAQTVAEGKNSLFAERYNSAIATFEKVLAVNPNDIDAIYWLGQTYLEGEEIMSSRIAAARQLYEKAMQSTNGAPLIMVGLGHVELLDNKANDARQKFETALTMTKTRKGDNPEIANAVGRANTGAKNGDYNYAIEKLQPLADKGIKDPETYVILGNAYRKAGKGEGGGEAFRNYTKALEFNPNFALADLRLAKLFESQKNWELFLKYLTDAVTADAKFTAAYYDLFYYYFYRLDYTAAETQLQKFIDSKLPEKDIQDEFLYSQLCWARKDYNCATSKAEAVVNALGDKTKPKVYRLLADAYFQNGNFNDAKKYSDVFFAKKNPDDIILYDYQLRADIMDKTGGTTEEIFDTYVQGISVDTLISLKIDYLKLGADRFKAKGDSLSRNREGDLRTLVLKLKEDPSQRDYFDAGFAYYQGKNYEKADSVFDVFVMKFPDEPYGYMMEYNIHRTIDSTMTTGAAVPWADKYLAILEKDTVKNKNSIMGVAGYLAQYYANVLNDKPKALDYLRKMLALDPENAAIQGNIEILEKALGNKSSSPAKADPSTNKTGFLNKINNSVSTV